MSPELIDIDWWNCLPEDRRTAQFEDAAKRMPLGRVCTSLDVA